VIKGAKTIVKPGKWRTDPYVWRVVHLTFDKVLDALAPPGEIRNPPPPEEVQRAGGILSEPGRWNTPESIADFLSRTIMFTFENHETIPVPIGKRLLFKDEMAEAKRNLALPKEGKGQ